MTAAEPTVAELMEKLRQKATRSAWSRILRRIRWSRSQTCWRQRWQIRHASTSVQKGRSCEGVEVRAGYGTEAVEAVEGSWGVSVG